jgi:type II secretory pathway component PulJ
MVVIDAVTLQALQKKIGGFSDNATSMLREVRIKAKLRENATLKRVRFALEVDLPRMAALAEVGKQASIDDFKILRLGRRGGNLQNSGVDCLNLLRPLERMGSAADEQTSGPWPARG